MPFAIFLVQNESTAQTCARPTLEFCSRLCFVHYFDSWPKLIISSHHTSGGGGRAFPTNYHHNHHHHRLFVPQSSLYKARSSMRNLLASQWLTHTQTHTYTHTYTHSHTHIAMGEGVHLDHSQPHISKQVLYCCSWCLSIDHYLVRPIASLLSSFPTPYARIRLGLGPLITLGTSRSVELIIINIIILLFLCSR